MPIKFEWDKRKARQNLRNIGSILPRTCTIVSDTLSITIPDSDHSEDEERWVTIGLSNRHRLLVMVHTEEEETIRIMSTARQIACGGNEEGNL